MLFRCFAVFLVLFGLLPGAAAERQTDFSSDNPRVEIGGRLGLQTGMIGVGNGGAKLGATFAYRMSDLTWFDGEVAFVFGGGGACADEAGGVVCEPGTLDGFGAQLFSGLRGYLVRQPGGVIPYLRGGVSLQLVNFNNDVSGWAMPLYGAAGGRFEIAERVSLGAEFMFLVGPAFFDEGVGGKVLGAGVVQAAIDIALD